MTEMKRRWRADQSFHGIVIQLYDGDDKEVGGVFLPHDELDAMRQALAPPPSTVEGEHDSDCAVHNAPALEPGPCDCSAASNDIAELVGRLKQDCYDSGLQKCSYEAMIEWEAATALQRLSAESARSRAERDAAVSDNERQRGEIERLREALGASLTAMKIAAALPGVRKEYDFAPAIHQAEIAYAASRRALQPKGTE